MEVIAMTVTYLDAIRMVVIMTKIIKVIYLNAIRTIIMTTIMWMTLM